MTEEERKEIVAQVKREVCDGIADIVDSLYPKDGTIRVYADISQGLDLQDAIRKMGRE